MSYTFGPVTVPEEHYFFLGDNRNVSYDAHLWATPFVAKDQLVGKVLIDVNNIFSQLELDSQQLQHFQ